jgi:hypothetical protein
MAVFNRSSEFIQVASQPDRVHMQARIGHSDWCLSHLPEAGCFISHYCANSHAKQVMKSLYNTEGNTSSSLDNENRLINMYNIYYFILNYVFVAVSATSIPRPLPWTSASQ